MMMQTVATIGTMELSANTDNINERDAIMSMPIEAKANAATYLQRTSPAAIMFESVSRLTKRSLVPNNRTLTNKESNATQTTSKIVYPQAAANLTRSNFVRLMGFDARRRSVPILASPEIISPAINA